MQAVASDYTTESILATLGYSDPLVAAREQARMILLGRLSRYQAAVQQFERTWGCDLDDMRRSYERPGQEDFDSDDAYLEWQWYADAVEIIQNQLAAISAS